MLSTEEDEPTRVAYLHPKNLSRHVMQTAQRGNVNSVLAAMDRYGYKHQHVINVGELKGKILETVVRETNPSLGLELGTYAGYSALSIAKQLNSEAKLYSIELNEEVAEAAKEIIKFAGMDDKVTVIVGKSSDVISTISQKLGVSAFDFVFLDHWKNSYKSDLILLENHKLIKKGSVILADNVVYPGCPDYLEYVRNNVKYECTNYPSMLEYSTEQEDALEKSIYHG